MTSATDVMVIPAALQRAIETAISPLREQLLNVNQRAERAEQCADQAERQAASLQAELVEARVTERAAADRAAAAMAEAADLRRQLELAEEQAEEGRALVAGELARADQAKRRLADKEATIIGLVAEKQELGREVEKLSELLAARRSWWRRLLR